MGGRGWVGIAVDNFCSCLCMSNIELVKIIDIRLRLPIRAVHSLYITPFFVWWTGTDLQDGRATPKFWVLSDITIL